MSYQQKDGLGRLTLDDGKANAMQLAWCDELNQVLDQVERDPCHALVIEGRPGFFSAGLDLKVLPVLPPDELRKTTERFVDTMRRVFLFPKPVIAASAGHAIAGGMMLYLAADIRLAWDDETSTYGLNEATTGIPLLGGTAGLCQYSIPQAHHTEMILHGRILCARETHARGITHELAETPAQLIEFACRRARALENIDLNAYRINKLILRKRAFETAVQVAEELASEVPTHNVFEKLRR